MVTVRVPMPRDVAAAATRAWLSLLLLGALVAGFVVSGMVVGTQELAAGLLHIYGVCRALLGLPTVPLAALASVGPALALASVAVGGVVSVWDLARVHSLVRGFHRAGFREDPRVAALARRLGADHQIHAVRDPALYVLTAGLFRPAVFLSTGLIDILAPDELEAVLRHELAHVRGRDPLKVLLGRAVRRMVFFLPLVDDLWTRYVIGSELVADASVIAAQGRDPLARALVKLLPAGRPLAGDLPGFRAASDVRIDHLLQPGSVLLPRYGRTRSVLSIALLLVVLGAVPAHSPPTFLDVLVHLGLGC